MRRRKGPSPGRNPRLAPTPPSTPHPQTPRIQTPYERKLTTKRRGEISELAFALAAARHGFGIARPYGDSERYDIILDCRSKDPSHLLSVIPNQADMVRDVVPNRAETKRDVIPNQAEGAVRNLLSSRPRLIRVQVKSSTQIQCGLYRVNAHRRIHGRAVPYTLAEIDFFAAYVIPEDSWFIFPLPHILGQTSVSLSPKRRRKQHYNDHYREAWHYLSEPDSLEFA